MYKFLVVHFLSEFLRQHFAEQVSATAVFACYSNDLVLNLRLVDPFNETGVFYPTVKELVVRTDKVNNLSDGQC